MTSADAVSNIRSRPGADRTTLRQRTAEVDGLRAVAALMVLLSHAQLLSALNLADGFWLPILGEFLGHGVFLFFVLSGYLIGGPFVSALVDRGRLSDFMEYGVRRVARIFPAYWIAFTALLILTRLDFGHPQWALPVHYLLLQNWVPNEASGIFPIAWTLGIEVVFYALVPALATLARSWRPSVDQLAVALMLGGIAITVVATVADLGFGPRGSGRYEEWASYLRDSPIPWLALFVPGILVALGHTDAARKRGGPWDVYYAVVRRPWYALPLAAVLVDFAVVCELSRAMWLWDMGNRTLIALSSALVLGTMIESKGWSRPLRVLAPVGLISYGIYLWHWVLLVWIAQRGWYPSLPHGGIDGFAVAAAILLATTIPVATLSWFVVERPIIKWSARWAHAKAASRAQLGTGASRGRDADDRPAAH